MQALLSFDKAPPFAAPLRFFLTGPLFAVAAGLLLVSGGPAALASRWGPEALAAVHLVTVGFMLHIMLGALIQILPVVAGANVKRSLVVATIVHGVLGLGTVALVTAFLTQYIWLFLAAAGLLTGAVVIFLAAAGRALYAVPSTSPTINGLKVALAALAVVIALGVTMALALALGWSLPLALLADLHAGWGFGAWAGVLLASMAYVVVPMFQLTPPYPARPSWWFPPAVILALILWSGAVALEAPHVVRLAEGLSALAGLGFAGFTLNLQRQRRRARADATYRYWQLGLYSVFAAMTMLLAVAVEPRLADWRPWSPLFAVFLAAGGFMSLIIGMMYKIVPFLAWLHLQNIGRGRIPAPNMGKILADRAASRQVWSHAVAVGCLLAAALFPDWLARPAGAVFAVANAWLFANLAVACGRYRQHAIEMAARIRPGS